MADNNWLETASQGEQARKDREYLNDCREHGIEPMLPRYDMHKRQTKFPADDLEDCDLALSGAITQADFQCFDDDEEPSQPQPPGDSISEQTRDAFEGFLSALTTSSEAPGMFVRVAGTKILCLSWMLGRGAFAGRSLADIARELGISRALLSLHVRRLEQTTGIHARGQRSTSDPAKYRKIRLEQAKGKKATVLS